MYIKGSLRAPARRGAARGAAARDHRQREPKQAGRRHPQHDRTYAMR